MAENSEKPVMVSELKSVLRSEIQPILIEFYQKIVEPGMERMFEEKFEEKIAPLRDEMHQGFDDLYKKFEKLEQEYLFANVHIKRLNLAVFGKNDPN